MSALVISNLDDALLLQLNERAKEHGRTPEDEAKQILLDTLQSPDRLIWSRVEAIREQFAKANRKFSDSADLVREDRER